LSLYYIGLRHPYSGQNFGCSLWSRPTSVMLGSVESKHSETGEV